MFCKRGVHKNSAIFTGKHLLESLFNKVAGIQACNFLKKTLPQVFSCEYCHIFKNIFFNSTPLVTHSDLYNWIPKRSSFFYNSTVMKAFKYSFPIHFAFNMSIRCSERATQPETIFFNVNFFVIIIYRYFLFVFMQKRQTYVAFICVNPPVLFLLIIFIVLLPYSMNSKFSFEF